MRIIPDLSAQEAVIVGDMFLIVLPPGKFEISGGEISNHHASRQIMVDDIDSIYQLKTGTAKLIGFTLQNGTPYGSVEDHHALLDKNARMYENGYPSLDVEFAIRSAMKKYDECIKVFSTPETIREKIEFTVIGEYIETGSNFIESALHFGFKHFQHHPTGLFRVLDSSVAMDEYQAARTIYPKLHNASHSHIRYCQYGSTHVFSGNDVLRYPFIEKADRVSVHPTLEAAKVREAEVRKYVRNMIMLYAEPKAVADLPEATVLDVKTALQGALSNLQAIDPNKKTGSYKATAAKYLNEAMEKLTEANNQES